MKTSELKEGMYVSLTKDISAFNLPEGTLGIISHVFTDKRVIEANEPYVCIIDTIPEPNLAVSIDEIEPTTVGGAEYASYYWDTNYQ